MARKEKIIRSQPNKEIMPQVHKENPHKANCKCSFCSSGTQYHKPNCKCFCCRGRRGERFGEKKRKRKNKNDGGSKEGAQLRLVRESQPPPSEKGEFMGNNFNLEGKVNNNLDKTQLQKLIGELREKVLKEIAASRSHYKLALSADRKNAKSRVLKEVALSRFYFDSALDDNKKIEQCEERLAEMGFYPRGENKGEWLKGVNR